MEGGHDGGGQGGGQGGALSQRGHHERGRAGSQRPYVSSAIGSSDILSTGDDGPTFDRGADGSEGSRTQSSRTSHGGNTASTSKKSKRLSFGRTKPRAEVSWADKKSMDAGKYTFFRDPTPPPPEEKADGAARADVDDAEPAYDYRYDHVAPPAPLPQHSRRCGMKKRTFWIVVAAILVALAIAIGVGVGVGVSSSKSDSSSDTESSGSKDRDASPTSSKTASASETTSTAPARATTTSRSSCPAANNTIYSVPGSDKTFLRICGIDYSGEFGGDSRAKDIGVVVTKNMEDCMVNCAGFPGCTGCGWGIITGDEGDEHRCWLKSSLGKSHVARPGWDFAILQ